MCFRKGGEDERLCDCTDGNFKCNTGRCIPSHYICDGKPQCADLSDDWDCFNLVQHNNETIKTTINSNDDESIAKNILQIKRANDEYAFVCYDNWNLHHANMICERFGFSHSLNYSSVKIEPNNNNMTLVRINDNYHGNTSILSNLNVTDSCSSNEIVALECEQYGK